jgi:serine protease Do
MSTRFRILALLIFLTIGSVLEVFAQPKVTTGLSELSQSFEELASKVSPAVVEVFTTGYGTDATEAGSSGNLITRQRGSGSGVILDPQGYIVTNGHVVQNAIRLQVLLATDSSSKAPGHSILKMRGRVVPAKLVGIDEETDLAVLKIAETGLPFLELGDSERLKQGQVVLAFGSPFGLENSVTMGVVSAIARQLQPEDPMIYIQTDAPINPGNSGGPLVNTSGQVVGINTMIYSQSGGNQGVGFAAPSNIVQNVFNQLRKSGRVHRGEIGVTAQTITPTMATGLSLPQNWGVIVADVVPGSSAEQAGLQIGDLISTLDGKAMENGRQFDVNLYRRAAGETVTLEVFRGSNKLTITVSVTEREEEPNRFVAMANPDESSLPRLGIFCIPLDDDVAKLIPSLRKQYGVVIAARIADAPYWANGFKPGDVIHSLNGVLITSLSQLRSKLNELKSGDPVVVQIERLGKLQYVAFEIE